MRSVTWTFDAVPPPVFVTTIVYVRTSPSYAWSLLTVFWIARTALAGVVGASPHSENVAPAPTPSVASKHATLVYGVGSFAASTCVQVKLRDAPTARSNVAGGACPGAKLQPAAAVFLMWSSKLLTCSNTSPVL